MFEVQLSWRFGRGCETRMVKIHREGTLQDHGFLHNEGTIVLVGERCGAVECRSVENWDYS